MAINTIAGFNPSFPELISTRSGPFSSIDDLTAANNSNFRVIGNNFATVSGSSYRNLNSSSPTITGGNFYEKYFNRSIEDYDILQKQTTVNIHTTGTYTISLSNRNQYIKLNSLSAIDPELVLLPELDLHPRETFEITNVNNVFTLSAAPTVTVHYINPGDKYFSLCIRCLSSNEYEALGNPFNFYHPVYPIEPKVFDFDYETSSSGPTDVNFFQPETNFFLSSSFETSLTGTTDDNFFQPETNFFLSSSFETSSPGATDVNFYYLSS
jgi:hypothetical protein